MNSDNATTNNLNPQELMLLAQLQVELLIRIRKLGEEYAEPHSMSQQVFEEASTLFDKVNNSGLELDMKLWAETFLKLYDGDMARVKRVLYQAVSIPPASGHDITCGSSDVI